MNVRSVLAGFMAVAGMASMTAQTPAFPGAEGGGKYATGGRGGEVYYVTNLNDSGSGSLREAVNKSGARTIVFKVAGTINLQSRLSISNGNLTIAGQTAPGDGICLKGNSVYVGAQNVIIRFIRFRPGDENPAFEDDAIWGRYQKNIILDHCSMSFSVDECASFYSNQNFTMQWCFLCESLNNSQHAKGAHGYGGLWGGENASFHHNVLAHHNSRNARLNGYKRSGLSYKTTCNSETVDFRNNVIFNWGSHSAYGGEAAGQYNMVGNYYKYGPASNSKNRLLQIDKDSQPCEIEVNGEARSIKHGVFYLEGNYMYGDANVTADNWNSKGIANNSGESLDLCRLNQPVPFAYTPTHSAEVALEKVLDYAGASLARDAQDARVAGEVRSGVPTYSGSVTKKGGLIDTPSDVGGYCTYSYDPASVPVDTDADGMPDEWEEANGLNPQDRSDRNTKNEEGYTMLEVYLNSLVAHITEAEYEGVMTEVSAPVSAPSVPEVWSDGINLHIRSRAELTGVEIFSIDGRCRVSQRLDSVWEHTVPENGLGEGVYIVRFRYADGRSLSTRFMK